MRKKLWLLVLALLLVSVTFAQTRTVKFAFDRSDTDIPGFEGMYRVWLSPVPGVYDLTEGTQLVEIPATGAATYEFELVLPYGIHFMTATLMSLADSTESDLSNQIKFFVGPRRSTAQDTALGKAQDMEIVR